MFLSVAKNLLSTFATLLVHRCFYAEIQRRGKRGGGRRSGRKHPGPPAEPGALLDRGAK